jgi:hypothetical protein
MNGNGSGNHSVKGIISVSVEPILCVCYHTWNLELKKNESGKRTVIGEAN